MAEKIRIKKGERKAEVVESAFKSVWKPKGWTEDKDADSQGSTGGTDEEAVKQAQADQEKAAKASAKKS